MMSDAPDLEQGDSVAIYQWVVDYAPGRLDQFVAEQQAGLSRSQVAKAVSQGQITVNGTVPNKAGAKLRVGDRVELALPPAEVLSLEPQMIPLSVVFEDTSLIVIDKQAGLVVHPAHGHPDGTLVNALLHHCADLGSIGGVIRPGIVHRIDRETTGLLVVAKTEQAHRHLAEQIKAHSAVRRYMAVVKGRNLADSGSYETLFGRHRSDRKRFSCNVREGKQAITHYRVVDRSEICALVDVELETGRTHQIRVHFAEHGHGLIGDPVYGRGLPTRWQRSNPDEFRAAQCFPRQALHAYQLSFQHPESGQRVTCHAAVPDDLRELCDVLFGTGVAEAFAGTERVVVEPAAGA